MWTFKLSPRDPSTNSTGTILRYMSEPWIMEKQGERDETNHLCQHPNKSLKPLNTPSNKPRGGIASCWYVARSQCLLLSQSPLAPCVDECSWCTAGFGAHLSRVVRSTWWKCLFARLTVQGALGERLSHVWSQAPWITFPQLSQVRDLRFGAA